MTRPVLWRAASTAVLVLVTAFAPLSAQQMPDAAQMSGQPLPAPELPQGSVTVRLVRERLGNDLPGYQVQLRTPQQTMSATSNAQGRAQFDGLAPGTVVSVEATVDGETVRSQEFPIPASGGVRVALVTGIEAGRAREAAAAAAAALEPARPGIVVFGGESRVILEFQNDNLQVFYLLDIVNNARTPISVAEPLVIELPDGVSGAGALQGSSSLALVQGDRVRVAGPFPPGTTSVQFGYRFPYSGADATIVQRWPAAFEQLFVAVEKVGNLQIASPQFTQQQEARTEGGPFVMATGGRIEAGDALTLQLSGLPYHSTTVRDVGIAIGILVLAVGIWFGVQRPPTMAPAAVLHERRERLFGELVALEAQQRQGAVDERRYRARRQTLVTQIERVMADLESSA